MEWAIHTKGDREEKDLDSLKAEPSSNRAEYVDPFQLESRRVIRELFGPIQFSRLYFGNEFCERLIPSRSALARFYSASSERGLAFSFLSPYVTDEGIGRLLPLFSFLAAKTTKAEVVVNDWGVLRLLRREFPSLRPVLGRLLSKTLRDPLAASYYSLHPDTPKQALSALRQSNLTVPAYRAFLRGWRIGMVEVDNLIQGMDMNFRELGFAGSLYVPYGFVATGRTCLFGSLNQPKEKKFAVSTVCLKECQRHYAECRYDEAPFQGNPFVLLHRGNTLFYPQPAGLLRSALLEAQAKGIERVIYQPEIPM